MKHFYSFQKKKALAITAEGCNNVELATQFNHELMQYGYIMSAELQARLATCSVATLDMIYHDLLVGIQRVIPGGGYEMIYKGFPASVVKLSQEEFINNAIKYYQSNGEWAPEQGPLLTKVFNIELIDYQTVNLMTEKEFINIFYNIIYSNNSISSFDKEVVEWFLHAGYEIDFSKIVFKETLAYVGKQLLDVQGAYLPTKNATDILRIWSAYSGGDEGLKENTHFKNPNSRQRQVLLNSLNNCYNLEEEFKGNREKWLRLLYFLHPMTPKNRNNYSQVALYADKLRNTPKELFTFNAKVEKAILEVDTNIFSLLKKRMGVFTRRLDHLIRVFGAQSVTEWINNAPRIGQLVDVYNHLYGRDTVQGSRTAVLAGQGSSEVVSYKEVAPLPTDIVTQSRAEIGTTLKNALKGTLGKVYIDPILYYRPLATNNRASSFSLDGKVIGAVEVVPAGNTIRAYVAWSGRDDIDLSGLAISNTNVVTKIGWNGSHNMTGSIVYSGDNTGTFAKNTEYLDITPSLLPPDIEWVVLEARIYRGPASYSKFSIPVMTGWMLRESPGANHTFRPDTTKNAMVLSSDSNNSYLSAYHVPTRSIVYLDVSQGGANVSGTEDALRMRVFLNKFVSEKSDEVNWDKINQGHVLHLLATEVVLDRKNADKVFDENTPQEEVMMYL